MIGQVNVMSESAEQKALIEWWALECRYFGVPECLLMAIPNGGKRDRVTGARLKAEGVRAGVPDLFLAVARGPWHGLWIEMKTEKGKVSREQKKMIPLLCEQGYHVIVCHGWVEAEAAIECYLRAA